MKELEEFAFKGIPDVRGSRVQDAQILEEMVSQYYFNDTNSEKKVCTVIISNLVQYFFFVFSMQGIVVHATTALQDVCMEII